MTDTTDGALDALVKRLRKLGTMSSPREAADAITALRAKRDAALARERAAHVRGAQDLADFVQSIRDGHGDADEAANCIIAICAERDALREKLETAEALINGGMDDGAMAIIAAERAEVLALRQEVAMLTAERDAALADEIRALADAPPAPVARVKPPEGPQHRSVKTCLGCVHFKSEYWREPSGDGETYDSGTSADCLKMGRSISTYGGSEPAPPHWCPFLQPQSEGGEG